MILGTTKLGYMVQNRNMEINYKNYNSRHILILGLKKEIEI